MNKFDSFIEALESLCTEHGVQLCASGYDGIEVWNLQPGDVPIYAPSIDNCIEGEDEAQQDGAGGDESSATG